MADFQPMKHLELVPVETLPETDSLKVTLQKQKELMEKHYFPILSNATLKDRNDYSVKVTLAISSELEELKDQLNWKWFKKPHEIDQTELKFEIIDLYFFVLTLMVTWEMTPEEAYSLYLTKHKENVRRQENGY